MKRVLALAIACLSSGFVLAAAWATKSLAGFAVLIGLVLMFTLLTTQAKHGRLSARTLWLAFAVYVGQFSLTLSWTSQFSVPGRVILTISQALIAALPFLFLRPHRCPRGVLTFAAALTIGQWLRSRFPFEGLPMSNFDAALASTSLAPTVALFGQLGLTFIAGLIAGLVVIALPYYASWMRARNTNRHASHANYWPRVSNYLALGIAAFVLLAPVVGNAMVGSAAVGHAAGRDDATPGEIPTSPGSEIEVFLIQGGGDQGVTRENQRPQQTFERHIELAAKKVPSANSGIDATSDAMGQVDDKPRLIVLPENIAVSSQGPGDSRHGQTLAALAQAKHAWVIAGFVESLPNDKFNNFAVLWNPNGELVGQYAKRHRVPFGEYVPARKWVEKVADLSQVPSDATKSSDQPLIHGDGLNLGVGISYEVMFGSEIVQASQLGAEVIALPTNASSYFSPQVSKEQLANAQLRALENNRWVLLAAPTGVSAIVRPNGEVVSESSRGEATTLSASIQRLTEKTPYAFWGNFPILAMCLIIALFESRFTLGKSARSCNLSPQCRTQ